MNLSIDWNTTELLAIAGFALGLICSLFLFYVWIKYHRNRSHILLWSGGLTLFYIFLIPFIWANLGINVVLDKWTNFFIFTIPLIFLGWVLVYLGIIRVKLPLARKIPTIYYSLLFFWVLSSFFFYAIRFYSSGYQQLLSIIGIAVFFIAIHILILLALLDWIKKN
ncbi:MAG: hypothetical protein A3H01_00160 [Candidatus Wildermuthbacteria bacterium RIFCSPLOWO2_12_FULL_40_9]|uniref:Histidine kinase N-terminal 7TM region domain-containing protein n=1 Tax=Candidatus Wildermuthbacteria bacterium RIFCSPLOWO2_12_FULL_40_9 TaxID=1802467 RepID=A0A1G2RUP5_9BACT|nr:MAG: hypothetical protein A3H01_00160 [Candidatus Wildermuthbacteria bacterium RIFCSPLOWO2_12_FULL_40_9]